MDIQAFSVGDVSHLELPTAWSAQTPTSDSFAYICPGWPDASAAPDQMVCNLTVSMGTISGLIFYANIVCVNHVFLFVTPMTPALNVFQQVLVVFIAWLNLDPGIETCC